MVHFLLAGPAALKAGYWDRTEVSGIFCLLLPMNVLEFGSYASQPARPEVEPPSRLSVGQERRKPLVSLSLNRNIACALWSVCEMRNAENLLF